MVLTKRKLERYINRGIHQLEVSFDCTYTDRQRKVIIENTMYILSKEYKMPYTKPDKKMSMDAKDSVCIVSENARELIRAIEGLP